MRNGVCPLEHCWNPLSDHTNNAEVTTATVLFYLEHWASAVAAVN